jgi:hypothetical protein
MAVMVMAIRSAGWRVAVAFGSVLLFVPEVGYSAGLNLSWDDCGTAGSGARHFACDTNKGADHLVGSFVLSEAIDDLMGIQAQVDLETESSALPDWWRLPQTRPQFPAACRDTDDVRVGWEFGGATACFDPYDGRVVPSESGHAYDAGFGQPNRGRLLIQFKIGEPGTNLAGSTEYNAFRIDIGHDEASGVGRCEGCEIRACIVLNSITLYYGDLSIGKYVVITDPANRNHVTWQDDMIPACPEATPARRTTWGQIRSVYR